MKKLIVGILITTMLIGCGSVTEIETPTETPKEVSYTYIICDVVSIDWNNGTYDAIMQDGNIECFYIPDDAPKYFDEVCFRTENLSDFTTYEEVALR